MILSRVIYELFESDEESLKAAIENLYHEIDREIRLVFSDGEDCFISWAQDEESWHIEYQAFSFFKPNHPIVRDMSDHPVWDLW